MVRMTVHGHNMKHLMLHMSVKFDSDIINSIGITGDEGFFSNTNNDNSSVKIDGYCLPLSLIRMCMEN